MRLTWPEVALLRFARLIEGTHAARLAVLGFTLYTTFDSYLWAKAFVTTHPTVAGLEAAAIIGAVLLPVSWMQKAVLQSYLDARKDE